jgi:type III restriction enzyme
MSNFEVPTPILNSPYEPPRAWWRLAPGEPPQRMEGRRPSFYFFADKGPTGTSTLRIEMKLVNRIRERRAQWRAEGFQGASRLTQELLAYWEREGRKHRLFFAQREAAETVIFLTEARADYLQGLDIPRDLDPGDKDTLGGDGFARLACKLATGCGKTTVMGMLAAWSILNKVHDRSNRKFSDVVLIVCPNVTIRDRLRELDPEAGEASLYRTRDLAPEHLMTPLRQGRVVVTNWHVFEPQSVQTGGVSAKVMKTGVKETRTEWVYIGPENTTARQRRYLTMDSLNAQISQGLLTPVEGEQKRDKDGNLLAIQVRSERWIESDAAVIRRVLGREVGAKSNILVFNDEAHHAYRVRRETDEEETELFEEDEESASDYFREATVWIEGLDRINKLCGINACVDLSATPYFLGRVGQQTNRPFPWVVSDFGLIDAIESGLVKIPQLAVRDTTGRDVAGFFNVWEYVMERLTPAERGGRRASPRPEAVLKHAALPILQLAGLWERECARWEERGDARTPVFIVVCKNIAIAKVIYEWLAEGKPPAGIPPSVIEGFRNDGRLNTIRVDNRVASETDSGHAQNDEHRWMRFQLDTVGRQDWPGDRMGRPMYPEGFEELAKKLERPLHPPGRDARCIVSVAMLTEGWDCSTVTHIIGLRPFMSQLLCEQVVGRALRRRSYQPGDDDLMEEEVAKVFGVPFELVPFKQSDTPPPPPPKRYHIYAIPERRSLEIRFPRVIGYAQALGDAIPVDWEGLAPTVLDPARTPPETDVQAFMISEDGRAGLGGLGPSQRVDLEALRAHLPLQRVQFGFASELARLLKERGATIPPHALFPRCLQIVRRYFEEFLRVYSPFQPVDAWHSPFFTQILERLQAAIRLTEGGRVSELPILERFRPTGSTAEVDFWTTREPTPVRKSHVSAVLADSKLEQQVVFALEGDLRIAAFVKNTVDSSGKKSALGFSIPYAHNGTPREFYPDFLIRLSDGCMLILETKAYPDLARADKVQGARRWVDAVNEDGRHGVWRFEICERASEMNRIPDAVLSAAARTNPSFA